MQIFETLGDLVTLACFVAASFLLATAFPASLFLVLMGVPLVGLLSGWIMLEPSELVTRWYHFLIGILCILFTPALLTMAWAFSGYLTWTQWLLIPAATFGFWIIGAIACTALHRKGYRLPF